MKIKDYIGMQLMGKLVTNYRKAPGADRLFTIRIIIAKIMKLNNATYRSKYANYSLWVNTSYRLFTFPIG